MRMSNVAWLKHELIGNNHKIAEKNSHLSSRCRLSIYLRNSFHIKKLYRLKSNIRKGIACSNTTHSKWKDGGMQKMINDLRNIDRHYSSDYN